MGLISLARGEKTWKSGGIMKEVQIEVRVNGKPLHHFEGLEYLVSYLRWVWPLRGPMILEDKEALIELLNDRVQNYKPD